MADLDQQADKPALDPNDPLDRIAIEAAGDEAARDQAEQDFINPPPEDNGIDPAQAWAQIPFMLGKVVTMALPELAGVYNEQACLQWGVGMAAVADKYGWDAGDTMAKWAPEIALTVASIPLVVPTYQAIKARKLARDKREEEEEEQRRPVKDLNDPPAGPMGQAPGGFVDPA